MKQLYIREPWSDLAYRSGENVLDDLLNRIQILEDKVRELEMRETAQAPEAQPAPRETSIPVRTRQAVPVGV